MAKKAKSLTAVEVKRLTTTGKHAVGGVAGLYLYVNEMGARSWVLRVMIGEKRRSMGLGGYPDVTLAQAWEKAREAREKIDQGIDPIAQRKELLSNLTAQQAAEKTFKQAAEAYMDAHGDSWKNPKHRAQWKSTLETYAYPFFGKMLVRDVRLEHVLSALEPIWKSKNETASRVRGRIETVLDWATARKLRSGENPARWKGHLDKLLAAPSKVQKVKHHKALPIDKVPAFFTDLSNHSGQSAKALRFAILTASRSDEVRGATWSEFDLEAKVWTIPSERMKAGKEHRVPLTESTIRILNEQSHLEGCDFVFSSPRGGKLSNMAMTSLMRDMKVDAVPHGFRSTFRDWAGERTNYPRDLAEQALAHAIENKVEAAYRRGDALEKRRKMMDDWDKFLQSQSF